MLNPYIEKIEGDLSRADVVVLTLLCRGKDVVEFGVGGSTIILSKIANSLVSYDTDEKWIDKISANVKGVDFRLINKDENEVIGEECDVLFNDGHSLLRWPFLLEYWTKVKENVILHDGRMHYAGNVVKKMIDLWVNNGAGKNPDNHMTGSLESIKWNWLESNMVVLKKRNCTLLYEDWKKTECQNYI